MNSENPSTARRPVTPSTIEIKVISSFSIGSTGGNPAGVVLGADDLSIQQKQQIASEAGLSETAFVSRSSGADFKLDFFTPTRQIAHCGHATIATFWYLNALGKIRGSESSKETIDGTRKIFLRNGKAFMEQSRPRFNSLPDVNEVLRSLNIASEDLQSNTLPLIGNTGNSFVLIALNSERALSTLQPDFNAIAHITSTLGCIGYYAYTIGHDASIQTRMFAPFYGINEESATGMAAGPLACLLYKDPGAENFSINQGKYMDPPSESKINIELNVNGSSIENLLVGGEAFVKETREVTLTS